MDCFKAIYFVVLAVIAIALAGCGSSGGGSPSPAPPSGPTTLDFVSQAVSGLTFASVFLNGTTAKPVDANGTVSIFLDADKMNLRVDVVDSATVANETITAKASAILSVCDKKVTAFVSANNPFDPPHPVKNCTSKVIDQMPSGDLLKGLIKQELQAQQVTRDSVSGFNKIQHTFDPSVVNPKAKGNFLIIVEMDDGSVLREVVVDGNLSAPEQVNEKVQFKATDSKATTPDASHFTVPKEWGVCHPAPSFSFENPALERFETLLNVIVQHITSMSSKVASESMITI